VNPGSQIVGAGARDALLSASGFHSQKPKVAACAGGSPRLKSPRGSAEYHLPVPAFDLKRVWAVLTTRRRPLSARRKTAHASRPVELEKTDQEKLDELMSL
jgi:hypothetical protein